MTSKRDAATAKKKSAAPSGVGTSTSLLPTVQPRSPTLDGEDRLQYEDAIPGPQDVAFSQTARPAQPVETRGTSFGRPVQPTDTKGENFSSLTTGPQGLQHSVQPSSIDQVDGILHDPVATAIAPTFANNSTGNENPNVTKAALDHFKSGEAPRRADARRKARTTVSSGSLAAKPHPPGRHPVRDGHDYAAGMHPGMKTNTKHKHVDRVTHPHDARAPADGPTAGTTIPNNTGLEQPSAASTALTNSGGHSGHEQVVQQTSDTAAEPSSHNAGVNRDRDPIGGADIATAGPHPSAETRGPPEVPGTTVLPRTTARTMALPPVGDPRHSLGTRSPTTDAKGRRTATGVTKKPKAKAQGYASPYGSLESLASVSPMWGTPVSTTNQLTTPALMTPDVMTPASSTPASPSPVMLATSDGPTDEEGAAVVHPPKAELDKAGRRPQESRKYREQHSPNHVVRAPAAPSGERRDKIKKASRATGNVRERKTKKEVIAARSGTSKETLSPKGIISACSSKELLGHGAVATVSSQSKAGIVSVAEPMLREKDRDLDRPLECAKNLAVSSSQSESPKSQELHPSERAEGFKTASHGKNGAASVDMLVFQPHESQLVVSVSPMSGTPPTTPTKTVTSQRTSLLRKASWPLRELRKFRLDSRSLASSPPLHSMSMQTLLPESMGDRSQWLVVVVVAFVVSGMLLALLSRWALVKKKQPSDLCFSPACLRYASHILLQVNRSLDPCQDFSAYACSAWNPPVARADYAITSTTQLIRAWFEGFRGLLQEASERGFTVANGPAAMLRACLSHATNPGVPGIQELRDLMASIHLRWPDPPEDGVSPIGVILRLSYVWGVRTWFTIRVYRPSANTSRAVHLSPADSISFLAKHHRRVVASKAYEHLWLAFYYRFQKPGSETTAPNASVIESSAKMQSFVLNQVIEAKLRGKSGPACFPVSGLGRYTANISSVEWVAEINSAIPRTQVLASDNVSVSDLSVIRAIDAIFRSYSRPEIMDYMGWQLAQLYGPLVDPELSKEYFGDHERAAIYLPHVCAKQVEISYSGLPSALYYSTRLDEPARSAVRTTLESVVNTTAVLIERVPWLDVGTKSAAAAKIRSAKVNLWPPSWILEKEVLTRVYSRFPVNATSLTDFLTQSTNAMVELLESETDFAEVLLSPLSGSMPYFSYDRALNEVSISAGAVQFPLFVPGGTTSMNYGGLGFSFALQLVRSLDSASRTVAAQGRCSNGDDGTFSSLTAALRQRSSCLARVYNGSFFPEVAALEAVHAAYVDSGAHHNGRRIVDVFTNEQVFFIALCYFNCGRPRGRRDFYTSCNKAVLHYPPFAKAFGCSLRSLMNPSGNCGFF